MKILGIDYGSVKIGLAMGETESGTAVPLEVTKNEGRETIEALAEWIKEEHFELVVVGVPLSPGSHYGPDQIKKNRRFISLLKEVVNVPVEEEDESFTTAESLRLQLEEGAQAEEDALAAMLIVQQYMANL